MISIQYGLAILTSFFHVIPGLHVKNQQAFDMDRPEVRNNAFFTFSTCFQLTDAVNIAQFAHNCLFVIPIVAVIYGIRMSTYTANDRVRTRLFFVSFITALPFLVSVKNTK